MQAKAPLLRFIDSKLKWAGITHEQVENAEVHNGHVVLTIKGFDGRVRIDLPSGLR